MAGPQDISATEALQVASTYVNGGRYTEAVALSQSILQSQPNNADALHILGLSQFHLGQYENAEPSLAAAIKARSSDATIANSYALVLLALDKTDEAATRLEKFARKGKLTPAGLATLGDCRLRQNQPDKALACLRKALAKTPTLTAARVTYGEALKQSGDLAGAIKHYRELVQSTPSAYLAWRNLGLALQDAEQFEESIEALETYLARRPDDLQSRLSLAASFLQSAGFERALEEIDKVLEVSPDHAEAWNNKGLALRSIERLADAENAFMRAIDLDPSMSEARTNLAHLAHDLRGIDAALEIFDRAIASGCDVEKAHVDRGFPLLSEGRIREGWSEHRWSEAPQDKRRGWRPHKGEYWSGQNLAGKTVLVWGEQGIGDEIIYASMIPNVIAQAGKVLIECDARLVPLYERSFVTAEVYAREPQIAPKLKQREIDFHISVADLCPILRPDLAAFTDGQTYLSPNPSQREAIRKKYSHRAEGLPLIGIAWRSGRKNNAWLKSIPLREWHPIFEAGATNLISLQYGDLSEEIESAEREFGVSIFCDDQIDPLTDMDGFASQVAAMDLVITNSNTAAHVAGALGVPTWVMVPRSGSGGTPWYWQREGAKCPWYNSVQLYRQTRFQNWESALSAVATDMAEFYQSS